MEPTKVFNYGLQFHEIRKELDDDSQASYEDLVTSHNSLAQGYLLLDK